MIPSDIAMEAVKELENEIAELKKENEDLYNTLLDTEILYQDLLLRYNDMYG